MCFSAQYFGQLLVWLVVISVVFAILRLLLPLALSQLGAPGAVLAQVLNLLMWAAIVIAVIWICVDLLSCLGGGLSFPHH